MDEYRIPTGTIEFIYDDSVDKKGLYIRNEDCYKLLPVIDHLLALNEAKPPSIERCHIRANLYQLKSYAQVDNSNTITIVYHKHD